jgi:HD-GYP domain-containing protein (c-di-GMP phosphodiesterase class II)
LPLLWGLKIHIPGATPDGWRFTPDDSPNGLASIRLRLKKSGLAAYCMILEKDIGKIGLSRQVLKNTRNRLPAEMLAQVRQHPQIGVAILKDFNLPKAIIDFVHFHHEKMDGSGYPQGLISYQIPLGAKIIRVADCFDAITTDRPYQQRKNWIEAFAILHQISGTDLNSELVEAFMSDIKENGLALHQSRSISLYSPIFDRLLL